MRSVKPILKTKNRYIIRLAALFYAQWVESEKMKAKSLCYLEDLDRLIGDFYREDNQKIIKHYPHLNLQNYPQQYQL